MNFAEVIAGAQELFLVGPADSVDVRSIGALRPHSWNRAQTELETSGLQHTQAGHQGPGKESHFQSGL